MSDIGTPMDTPIPAVGSSGTGYATGVNAFLTEVQNRLEAQVPRSSLEAGDLDLDGSALQNASYVGLADALLSPTTPINTLQAFGGEVFWISPDGPVQITSGGTLNSAAVGGITGDYGSPNPAELRFVDADQEYYFYDDFGGGIWAYLQARGVDIAAGATSANRVRLAYGGGGSYTLTLPTAAPAATEVVQMSSSGELDVSGSISNFRHGDWTACISPMSYNFTSNAAYSGTTYTVTTSGATVIYAGFQLTAGDRPKSFVLAHKGDGSADITVFVYVTSVSNSATQLGSVAITNPAASWSTTTIDLTDTTLSAGDYVSVSLTCSATGLELGGMQLVYSRP